MQHVRIHVVGKSPLMMDMMSDATLEGLETGIRPPEEKGRPSIEKAADKIYRNDEGIIALRPEMICGALVNAGRKVKNGKTQISTAKTTTLFDFFTLLSTEFVLTASKLMEKPAKAYPGYHPKDIFWVVDKRKGIGYQASTPTAVCIVRPKFGEWEFDMEFGYEKTINRDTMRRLVSVMLSSEGLGAFRPNKRGPFGRSAYNSWKELQQNGTWKELYVPEVEVVEVGGAETSDEDTDLEAAELTTTETGGKRKRALVGV